MAMADRSEMFKRGARIEMQKRHKFVELPRKCASCLCAIMKSDWLRCNTCLDINICVPCSFLGSRYPCLDTHTFTAMFRIHELSLKNVAGHDYVLKKVMEHMNNHRCNTCHQPINLLSWVRCNECSDFDLCMKCWGSSYDKHCRIVDKAHTFTNMTHRYRLMMAPTCAFLTDEEQSLALFRNIGIDMSEIRPCLTFDRAYCSTECTKANTSAMHTCWTGNWKGASAKVIPYYCPVGWRRFSVAATNVDFESSVTVYHGTRPSLIAKIFKNGLLCRQCQHGFSAAYVSPSITYCAHPRYSRVVKMRLTESQVVYAQFVVELRVNLSVLQTQRKRETLSVGSEETIDPHFPENESIELLLCKEPAGSYVTGRDGVHMTGIMVRVYDHDPFDEAEAWWWPKWKSIGYLKQRFYEYEPGVNADDDAETFAVNDEFPYNP